MLHKLIDAYDSEEDQNYEPTAKEKKEYQIQHMKKKKAKRQSSKTTHELYLEMKEQFYEQSRKIKQPSELSTLELANSIMNSDSIKPDKRIMFAGKEYILNQETGQLEAVEHKVSLEKVREDEEEEDEQQQKMKNLHISYQYLNHVMQAIYNRSKKINAIGKSKLDWKGFVKQEGIEEKLKYNRKGGVIQNMKFIKNTK